MDSDLLYVKNNNNQKMFPCGLFTEIKVFGSPKIPDWYENMLFKSMLELKSALQPLAKNVWSVHISLGSSSVEIVHVFWWIFCEVPRSTSAVQEKATTLFCCETPEMMTDSFRGTYPLIKCTPLTEPYKSFDGNSWKTKLSLLPSLVHQIIRVVWRRPPLPSLRSLFWHHIRGAHVQKATYFLNWM